MASPFFPPTRASAVIALRHGSPEERRKALERLLGVYGKPVYKHLRRKWLKSPEDAEDLSQAFFARAVEHSIFELYDPTRGRFRTFVRACVDRFVLGEQQHAQRQKRGGGLRFVSLDADQAEAELGRSWPAEDAEEVFDREWVRSVFQRAVERLAARYASEDKSHTFRAFQLHDLDDGPSRPSYAEVARALGVTTVDVTNYLHAARKAFRAAVLDVLREVTADDEEFGAEVCSLLGRGPSAREVARDPEGGGTRARPR